MCPSSTVWVGVFFSSFSVQSSVFCLEAMPLGIREKLCVVAARPKAALIIETGLCPFALALAKKLDKVNGRKADMCLFHIGNAIGSSSADLIWFYSLCMHCVHLFQS